MSRYSVSLQLDCRVTVSVDAESFDEARTIAPSADFEWKDVEVVEINPVNATDERGEMRDY